MQQTKTSSVRAQRWSRIGMATLFISMMLALIIFRLAWLQLFRVHRTLPLDSHSMISQSVIQRERGIVLDDRRGHIVDRKGRIITGEPIQSLVLFPINRADIQEQALNGLSRMLHEDVDIIRQRWLQAKEPILWYTSEDKKQIYALTEAETNYVNSRGWNGVRVLPYVATYPWKEHTPHWVGYTSKVVDNEVQSDLQSQEERTIGAYGLERSFQPLLKSIGASTYVHYTDAAGKPLSGLGVRRSQKDNPYYPLRLVTTADMKLQVEIAKIMDQHHVKKGSAVVMDVRNREVLAMVSRPAYNPNSIHPESGEWNNQALQAIAPGSVFKLVIAAAALETGVTSTKEVFHCDGHYHRYELSCWKEAGHGSLTLEQAFVQSCNVVFAELGERLRSKDIEQYADKLGLTGKIGMMSNDGLGHSDLPHFDGEQASRVFIKDRQGKVVTDGGIRAQTAIGQRDVRITPLAAANAIVTIVQQGRGGNPRLVEHIEDAKGNILSELENIRMRTSHETIRPQTARRLMKWMRLTITEGTGQALRDSVWQVAGKTGTAQAEAYGKQLLHYWLVGYAPQNQPKYAVVVVIQDQHPSADHPATAVYREIIGVLADYEKDKTG